MPKQISWDKRLLKWINSDMQVKHVAILIAAIGLVVFFSGLSGNFQGDDQYQIVDNLPVHNLQNIGKFFTQSTFWNGESLVGSFYRPIMTTVFSFIYSFFGSVPTAFHIVQLIIYMGCAFVLFLFLRTFFKPVVALGAALLFLVHPINSQDVFAIPSMQEPLFMLFGLLALWQLSKSQTVKNFGLAALFLLLSLLSKETGVVFILLSLLYVFLFHKKHTFLLLKILALPILIYLVMRAQSVGFGQDIIHAAPISKLDIWERLMTIPSIILFYIGKLLFPWALATGYYWIEPKVTLYGVILPFIIDLISFALVYAGIRLARTRIENKKYTQLLYFTVWAIIGLLPYLQIIPLDMTAGETWFISTMVGVLGMGAIIFSSLLRTMRASWVFIIFMVVIIVLGIRTEIRGFDYKDQYTIASKDVASSQDNYLAMNNLAQSLFQQNKFSQAKKYAEQSVAVYPVAMNYTNLGAIKQRLGDYTGAEKDYEKALTYGSMSLIYENLGIVHLILKDDNNIEYFNKALKLYPHDYKLWTFKALLDAEQGQRQEAETAITNAAKYGPVPIPLYNAIMQGTAIDVPVPRSDRVFHITW